MRKLIRILLILLCAALLAGMALMIYRYRADQKERAARIASLAKQAKEYESELVRLRREQETQEMQMYKPEGPGVAVVAVYANSEDVLTAALKLGSTYGVSPCVLLCVDDEGIESILTLLAEEEREVILSCRSFTAETAAQLRAVLETLEEMDCEFSHAFLLRAGVDTEENRQLLAHAGITTLFIYGDTLSGTVNEDGTAELNYSYVNKSSYSPANRLAALENSEQGLLFAIDLVESTVTERQEAEIFSLIRDEADTGRIVVRGVSDAVRTVKDRAEREQQKLEEYLTAQSERSARIKELEETIREIYSHWDD